MCACMNEWMNEWTNALLVLSILPWCWQACGRTWLGSSQLRFCSKFFHDKLMPNGEMLYSFRTEAEIWTKQEKKISLSRVCCWFLVKDSLITSMSLSLKKVTVSAVKGKIPNTWVWCPSLPVCESPGCFLMVHPGLADSRVSWSPNLHSLGCSVMFKEWSKRSLKIPTS